MVCLFCIITKAIQAFNLLAEIIKFQFVLCSVINNLIQVSVLHLSNYCKSLLIFLYFINDLTMFVVIYGN